MSSTIQEFDFSVNTLRALLWEYNDATNLQELLELFQQWYVVNQTVFWQTWYADVFNLITANDFGLAVWAIILGIPLQTSSSPSNKPNWGFGPYRRNFNRGNFVSDEGLIILRTEEKRIILRLRYFNLTFNYNIVDINRILADIFAAYGPVYIQDNLDMTITYVFNYNLSNRLKYFFIKYDALPRPAGVKLNIVVSP